MKKFGYIAAAIVGACLAGNVLAADMGKELKDAQAAYSKAIAKAKSDFDKAVAECKKGAEDKRHQCYKDARSARREARDAAADAYTNATGKPEPSPGA